MRHPLLNVKILLLVALLLLFAPVRASEEADWLEALKSSAADPDMSEKNSTKVAEGGLTASTRNSKNQDLLDNASINDMNPTDLRSHASVHLKDGEYDAAIRLVERAIELQPEDTDGRQIYADALERKLLSQAQPDPHVFNQCVKQWYFLYKNAEYPEMCNLAAKHLKDLTGKSPYIWPTPRMFLTRVLRPEPMTDERPMAVSEEPTQVH